MRVRKKSSNYDVVGFMLKVSKTQKQIVKPWILPKTRMNEFGFTTLIPQVDLSSFVFWKKLKTPKRHFEINWPLFEDCLHNFLLSDSDIAIIKVIAFFVILSQICQKFSIVPRPDLKDIFKFSHGLGDLLTFAFRRKCVRDTARIVFWRFFFWP